MDELELIRPSEAWREEIEGYRWEHLQNGETELHGGAQLDVLEFDAWLNQVRRNMDPATCRPDWVPADTFLVIRKTDQRLIGLLDVRRSLNAFLASFGGHIGYGVRPCERRKGYGARILALGLKHARRLGLERVMIACYAENAASRRTIEHNGGVLARSFVHTDGRRVCVYCAET